MFRCGKTLIALALLMGLLVAVCRNGRQSACSQQHAATGDPIAAECRAVEARTTRGAGCADCALSRRIAGECVGSVHLSARSGAGRSLAESKTRP